MQFPLCITHFLHLSHSNGCASQPPRAELLLGSGHPFLSAEREPAPQPELGSVLNLLPCEVASPHTQCASITQHPLSHGLCRSFGSDPCLWKRLETLESSWPHPANPPWGEPDGFKWELEEQEVHKQSLGAGWGPMDTGYPIPSQLEAASAAQALPGSLPDPGEGTRGTQQALTSAPAQLPVSSFLFWRVALQNIPAALQRGSSPASSSLLCAVGAKPFLGPYLIPFSIYFWHNWEGKEELPLLEPQNTQVEPSFLFTNTLTQPPHFHTQVFPIQTLPPWFPLHCLMLLGGCSHSSLLLLRAGSNTHLSDLTTPATWLGRDGLTTLRELTATQAAPC